MVGLVGDRRRRGLQTGEVEAEVLVGEGSAGAGWIAQVPGEAVHAAIDVAGAAGDVSEAGVLVCVVEVLAAEFDCRGGGVEEADAGELGVGCGADYGNRAIKAVEHVEALVG